MQAVRIDQKLLDRLALSLATKDEMNHLGGRPKHLAVIDKCIANVPLELWGLESLSHVASFQHNKTRTTRDGLESTCL